jgi:hypothetical protein
MAYSADNFCAEDRVLIREAGALFHASWRSAFEFLAKHHLLIHGKRKEVDAVSFLSIEV